jgi:hypothetical protein
VSRLTKYTAAALEAKWIRASRNAANLRKSLALAKAERDALVTLVEEINGRAQVEAMPEDLELACREALMDIRAKCKKGLKK